MKADFRIHKNEKKGECISELMVQDIAHPQMPEQPEPSISLIIHILEKMFKQINDKFFESIIQKPVIAVAPSSPRKDRLGGWCTSWRAWKDKDGQSDGYFEINICAEHLEDTFEEVFGTLLHEICHLLNVQEGKNDTSRSGTYHNKIFKKTAEAHGLIVNQTEKYGFNETSLSPASKEFVGTLDQKEFNLYRERIESMNDTEAKKSSTRKYICPTCGVPVRATRDVNIKCVDCDCLFVKVVKKS
jgi:hypothetical protein